jgi:hypothetical protein
MWARRLVDAPALDPDEAVLDHVHPADAVLCADPVQEEEEPERVGLVDAVRLVDD